MNAIPQADGDPRETDSDLDSPLEQGQDTGCGDSADPVEGSAGPASGGGLGTQGASGQKWDLTTMCGLCGGNAVLVSVERERSWIHQSAVVLDEFYRCDKCGEELYGPGQMDAVIARVKQALGQKPMNSIEQDAAIRLLQRQVKELQDVADESLPPNTRRNWPDW